MALTSPLIDHEERNKKKNLIHENKRNANAACDAEIRKRRQYGKGSDAEGESIRQRSQLRTRLKQLPQYKAANTKIADAACPSDSAIRFGIGSALLVRSKAAVMTNMSSTPNPSSRNGSTPCSGVYGTPKNLPSNAIQHLCLFSGCCMHPHVTATPDSPATPIEMSPSRVMVTLVSARLNRPIVRQQYKRSIKIAMLTIVMSPLIAAPNSSLRVRVANRVIVMPESEKLSAMSSHDCSHASASLASHPPLELRTFASSPQQ